MHRHQRRRTVELHRHRRPFHSQMEGHPPDRHARGGAQVTDAGSAGRHQVPVLAGADAGIYPGAASPQPVRVHPGILKRLPGRLEHHALPGIHHARLDRRDPEEIRVELVDLVHEPAAAVSLIPGWKAPGEIGRGSSIPASVRHRVLTRFELAPEGRQIRSAGEAARHADDRDSAVLAGHCRPCPCPGLCPCLGLGLGPGWGCGRATDFTKLPDQVPRERGDVRVVEHGGVGYRVDVRERPVQPVPQLHRHQRIHPQVEESHRGRRSGRQPQDRPDLLLQERHEQLLARPRGGPPQLRKQVPRRGLGAGIVLDGRGQQVVQKERTVFHRLFEHGPVHRHHHRGGGILPH